MSPKRCKPTHKQHQLRLICPSSERKFKGKKTSHLWRAFHHISEWLIDIFRLFLHTMSFFEACFFSVCFSSFTVYLSARCLDERVAYLVRHLNGRLWAHDNEYAEEATRHLLLRIFQTSTHIHNEFLQFTHVISIKKPRRKEWETLQKKSKTRVKSRSLQNSTIFYLKLMNGRVQFRQKRISR